VISSVSQRSGIAESIAAHRRVCGHDSWSSMAQRVEVAPGTTLPFLSTPHDTLRHGLPALKADAQVVHPVDTLQRQVCAPTWWRGARRRAEEGGLLQVTVSTKPTF